MSFPLPDPTAVPLPQVSQAQKDALAFLKSGATPFANPLNSHMGEIGSGLSGTMNEFHVTDLQAALDKAVADTAAAREIDPLAEGITAEEKAQIMASFEPLGLDKIDGVTSHLDGAKDVIATQSTEVVAKMDTVITKSQSYAATTEMFGEKPTICDSLKDLVGSLGGAADDLMADVKAGISKIGDIFKTVSTATKNALKSAIDWLKSKLSGIGGTGGVMGEISTAIASFKTSVSAFASDAVQAIKDGWDVVKNGVFDAVKGVKGMIGDMAESIKTGLGDIKNMVQTEMAKIGEVTDYLRKAAMALSFPSLNPCAKAAVANVTGAAGAGPLQALVTT